jgi:hypothetical protein
MGTVEVACVDVIDAELCGLSQQGNRGRFVPWRAEYAWPCQLHGAITQSIHDAVAEYKRSCRSGVRHADQLLNIGLAANDTLPTDPRSMPIRGHPQQESHRPLARPKEV